ncbi:hypothetical protein RIR_e70327_A0A2N0PV16_9GLOM [Rhizophagus irregularis DAOM 181602=DAOM 197198]|nr:hypothetical protein RIR_e70327_A0A2N0PV16_9GLOM [Rhizophagus irregularis DAOM 181602=DAOM 197198]
MMIKIMKYTKQIVAMIHLRKILYLMIKIGIVIEINVLIK